MMLLSGASLSLPAAALRSSVTLKRAAQLTTPMFSTPKGPSDYHLNLGKAVDSLRHSYPTLLEEEPDLDCFRDDVHFTGAGTTVAGLNDYRNMLAGMRMAVGATTSSSEVTHRLVVGESSIRVRWCAKMWLRDPTMELRSLLANQKPKPMQLDGVSVYELDDAARITEHRVEFVEWLGGEQQQENKPSALRLWMPMPVALAL